VHIDSAGRQNSELSFSSPEVHILSPEFLVPYITQAEWLKVENIQLISTLTGFRSATVIQYIRAAEVFKTGLYYILLLISYRE
jgi:hypothetical protein